MEAAAFAIRPQRFITRAEGECMERSGIIPLRSGKATADSPTACRHAQMPHKKAPQLQGFFLYFVHLECIHKGGGVISGHICRIIHKLAMERDGGLDTLNVELVKRTLHF